jgi:hypothetical protein
LLEPELLAPANQEEDPMRIVALAALLCAVALPIFAQEMEQILLPVAPSLVMCAYNSRYETHLVVYNQNARTVKTECAGDGCGEVGAAAGREMAGNAASVPLPTFLYMPKADADGLRMSLIVESGDRDKLEDRTFAELPIVRASQFVDKKISFVGVRMDPGFRQTIRIFGLDGTTYGTVQVRAYDLTTEQLVYDETMWLWPMSDERNEQGLALRPSFSMECDLSADIPANGHHVRIEIEPLSEGLKFWAFVSVTNNKTQHFYTIVPR